MTAYKRIESVRVAAEILKILSRAGNGLCADEIASKMGVSKGRALCHLATLQDAGLAETGKDGRFLIGPWAVMLSLAYRTRQARQLEEISASLRVASERLVKCG